MVSIEARRTPSQILRNCPASSDKNQARSGCTTRSSARHRRYRPARPVHRGTPFPSGSGHAVASSGERRRRRRDMRCDGSARCRGRSSFRRTVLSSFRHERSLAALQRDQPGDVLRNEECVLPRQAFGDPRVFACGVQTESPSCRRPCDRARNLSAGRSRCASFRLASGRARHHLPYPAPPPSRRASRRHRRTRACAKPASFLCGSGASSTWSSNGIYPYFR